MLQTAVANLRGVSSSSLTPPTALSIETNRDRLSQVDVALSTSESVRRALEFSAPTEEVVRDLYNAIIRLESLVVDDSNETSSAELKVLGVAAKHVRDTVHAWYLHSLGDPHEFVMKCKLTPSLYNFDAKREAPTMLGVEQLDQALSVIRQGLVNLARQAEHS